MSSGSRIGTPVSLLSFVERSLSERCVSMPWVASSNVAAGGVGELSRVAVLGSSSP